MSFTNKIGDYFYNNYLHISKLFNLEEQKDFLLNFVSKKEIDKFLSAGNKNTDHVKKLIAYIQYEEHDRLCEALINEIFTNHKNNEDFVFGMLKTCGGDFLEYKTTDERIFDTTTEHCNCNPKEDFLVQKEIVNYMKEILNDMRTLCNESQKLQQSQLDNRNQLEINSLIVNKTSNAGDVYRVAGVEEEENMCKTMQQAAVPNQSKQQISSTKPRKEKQIRPDDSPKMAEYLSQKGHYHRWNNNLNEALDFYTQALEMYQRLYRGDAGQENIAETLNLIGDVHRRQNNSNEALKYYLQALEIYQHLHEGVNHKETAWCLYYVACAYEKCQNWNKSLEYFKLLLKMRCQLYPGDNDEVALAINKVAQSLESLQIYSQALQHYTEAHRMYVNIYGKKLFGKDNDDVRKTAESIDRVKRLMKQNNK